MPPCALPETFGPLRTSQPHGIAALPVSADASGGGAVPRPVKGKARSRPIPVPAQITMRGSCDFFKERDASQLQEIVGATLLVEPGRAADQLKFISEDFFLRFAFHHAPTSDSKTAEWCRALVHDVGSLLENLVSPDKGYPDRQMSLQARIVLTNIGTDTGITERHLRWLGFGEISGKHLTGVRPACGFSRDKQTLPPSGTRNRPAPEGPDKGALVRQLGPSGTAVHPGEGRRLQEG